MSVKNLEKIRAWAEKVVEDPKIRDLVIGFRRWGIKTTNSCEGHQFGGYPYPWIRIKLDSTLKATRIIGMWNYGVLNNPIKWLIKPAYEPEIMPDNKVYLVPEGGIASLEWLQEEAQKFGKWL